MASVVVPTSRNTHPNDASARPLLSLRLLTFSVLLLVSTLLAAGMMSGCRTADPISPGNGNEQPLVRTTVVGTVVDEAGLPVAGAAVSSHGKTATSDKNGYFVMQNVDAPKDRCVAMAKVNGYFTAAKADITKENGLTQFKLHLMSHGTRKSLNAGAGGTLTLNSTSGTASLKFAPSGLATTGGAAFNGDAQVAIRHLDPADPSFAYYFAGDQAAIRENGERADLISYGVLRVDIRATNGEQLQPAAGKPAEITYPIPAKMMAAAPATMPLWFFDEQKGLWVEEGVVTKQGSSYVGSVKHFTDWNADYPAESNADLTGLVHCNGIPMPNVYVRIGQTAAYTDASGRFMRYVPIGIDLDVVVEPDRNQGLYASALMVVPMLTSRESRDITIPLTTNCPSTITGTLTDDQDRPIAGHIAWVNEEGRVSTASTLDGSFTLNVPGNTSLTLELASWSCSGSKTFSVTSGDGGGSTDVGRFKLCSTNDPVIGDIDISSFGYDAYAVLSPDGSKFSIAGDAPVIVVRSGVDGSLLNTANVGGGTYHYLTPPRYSSDGSRLSVYDYYQRQVLVFEVATGNKLAAISLATGQVTPDGNSVLGISGDSSQTGPRLALYSISTGQEVKAYKLDVTKQASMEVVGITSDGDRAVIMGNNSIIVYDLVNDAEISNATPVGLQLYPFSNSSMSDDGTFLSTRVGGNFRASFVINTQTGEPVRELSTLGNYTAPAISADGAMAAVQDSTQTGEGLSPRLVRISDGTDIKVLTTDGQPGRFSYFNFSRDGKRLLGVYRKDGKTFVRLWDL